MLKSMYVKNFAIIDNIQVDFSNGMTVLTGETGAGKSLIIDAIGLLFGDRASSELVRYGENKAIIEGVFENVTEKTKEILQNEGIDDEDFLTIKREIYENGKSLCKINGSTVSLSFLQEISSELGNIHTQFDNEKLVNPKNYIDFIDDEENFELIKLYSIALKKFNLKNKELQELIKNENESKQKLDFYKYQYNELTKAKLDVLEEDELKKRLKILANYEKISSSISSFIELYSNDGIMDKIYESIQLLEKLGQFDEKFKEYKTIVEENYYSINDILTEVNHQANKENIDYSEIDEINNRLGIYSDFKRKYKMTTSEILDYLSKITNEISKIENFDFLTSELDKEVSKLKKDVLLYGEKLSIRRKEIAKDLESKIASNLIDLQLNNTILEIVVTSNPNKFLKNGLDEIEIMISFNKGEPLKPLSKVASGGELSRFMLALKAVASCNFASQTLVFDEIDNGVSGAVAFSIASKIKEISNYCQVLCVTHLVQVAAKADHQLFITKNVDDDLRTYTMIKELNYEERIEEISKMASSGSSSETSRNFAKELLEK